MSKSILSTLYVLALLLASPAFADSHEVPGNVIDGWTMYIKDGMTEDFEEALKKHMKFRQRKDDSRSWDVYTPTIGDSLGFYVVRACCMKWSDLDSYREWGEENGIGEHWQANVNQYVKKYRHHLDEVDLENSNWPEDDSGVTLIGVTEFTIKPGSAGAMAAAKAKMSTLAKDGWDRHWAWGEKIGGKDIIYLASAYDNYAAMEPPATSFLAFLTEKMDSAEQAQELLAQFSNSYSATNYTVYRHRPDLSTKSK